MLQSPFLTHLNFLSLVTLILLRTFKQMCDFCAWFESIFECFVLLVLKEIISFTEQNKEKNRIKKRESYLTKLQKKRRKIVNAITETCYR